jgi:hypothetical protein
MLLAKNIKINMNKFIDKCEKLKYPVYIYIVRVKTAGESCL